MLRKLAEGCTFETITPDEILHDRLLFGVRDNKLRERLLRETKLTLDKTDEICRASESTIAQMKLVEQPSGQINAVTSQSKKPEVPWRRKRHGDKHATKECGRCGTLHDQTKRERCPAYGKTCLKVSHFASKCRSKKRDPKSDNKDIPVRTVDSDNSESEVFYAEMISAVDLDDSQLVTLKLESGHYLRFQPDTGAQCNVIPLNLYKKATKDYCLERVTPLNTQLAAYGGSKLSVVGQVRITVWRDDLKCKLDCKLVDSNTIRPLLGRKACVGMKIIKYTDNDELNNPQTGSAPVYSLERTTMEKVTHDDGVGKLAGEHHIRLDNTVDPVQHAP